MIYILFLQIEFLVFFINVVIEAIEIIKVDILILVFFTIDVIYSYKLNDGILSEKKESLFILYFFFYFLKLFLQVKLI